MAYQLKTWDEYLALRETNARKRAVQGALAGTHPPLPGSYAACPSTNVRAMNQAQKTGVVGPDPKRLTFKKLKEDAKPDYSFDRWLQKATEFGDDVNKMVGKAQDDEVELDKKADDDKKKATEDDVKDKGKTAKAADTKPKATPTPDDDKDKDEEAKKQETWKKLRQMHLDTLAKPNGQDKISKED